MKTTAKILVLGLLFSLPLSVIAQKQLTKEDTIVYVVKMKELQLRKTKLQQKISREDKNRNQHISGVTQETMELLNERQDSAYLELRSQLISILLELKEINAIGITEEIAKKYNVSILPPPQNANKENNR